jgi:hypothetical protein
LKFIWQGTGRTYQIRETEMTQATIARSQSEDYMTQAESSLVGEIEIENICSLNWDGLSADELLSVAWAYYYFSVQFRENLATARELLPEDEHLLELDRGERNTDNLSPYPGVTEPGERVNHDEFMRRALMLTPIDRARRDRLEAIGATYLKTVRSLDSSTKASSMASYEDGGLERVFRSMLRAPDWNGSTLLAFRYFLERHIEFDSDPTNGHGSLCRHLAPTAGVRDLWVAFKQSLVAAAPAVDRRQ